MPTIYVYLLNEGTDVWRPVDAEELSSNKFRIVSRNSDHDDEQWQFNAGDVVIAELRTLAGGPCLVAVAAEPSA